MLWIHSLVSVSHFAKFGEKRPLTLRNANEFHKMPFSALLKKVEERSIIRIREWVTTKS